MLAAVLALVLLGCNSSDSAFSDKNADAATASKDESTLLPDEDVACIPKREADMVGKNQNNGKDIPEERPGPEALPGLDDTVTDIEEPNEDEPAEMAERGTVLEELEAASTDSEVNSSEQLDQLQDRVQDIKQQDELPVCSGKNRTGIKEPDPGEMVVDLDTIKERRSIGDDPKTAEANPLETENALAQISDFFSTKEANAAGTCDNIAIVKTDTWATDRNVYSVAMSLSNQLYNHFRPDWGWCVQVGWVTNNPSSVPDGYWPLFLSHGPLPYTQTTSYHSYGTWPIYPSKFSPYGNIADTIAYGPGGPYGYNDHHWSVAISHEATETAAAPYAGVYNGWYNAGPAAYVGKSGTAYYAWEVADVVWPSYGYQVSNSYDGHSWYMANFALRSWFRQGAAPWDAQAKYAGGPSNVPGPLQRQPRGGFFPYYYPAWGQGSYWCPPSC